MGREVRRVPLDFAWPLHKPWEGFLNPHGSRCPENGRTCFNGYTAAGKWLEAFCRLIALAGEDAKASTPGQRAGHDTNGRIYPHPWIQEWSMAPRADVPDDVHAAIREHEDALTRMREMRKYLLEHPPEILPLTGELSDLIERFSGEQIDTFGGGRVSYGFAQKLLEVAGLDPEKWGSCRVCNGAGDDPAKRAAFEAWKKTPPPAGPGWQLWETVSEGSPTSPVFVSKDAFVQYLVGEGYSHEAVTRFAEVGSAPSAVMVGGEMRRDIESLAHVGEDEHR